MNVLFLRSKEDKNRLWSWWFLPHRTLEIVAVQVPVCGVKYRLGLDRELFHGWRAVTTMVMPEIAPDSSRRENPP